VAIQQVLADQACATVFLKHLAVLFVSSAKMTLRSQTVTARETPDSSPGIFVLFMFGSCVQKREDGTYGLWDLCDPWEPMKL